MKRIEAEWLSYQMMVVPQDACDIQIRETKKAFYGGAAALFDVQVKHVSKIPEVQAQNIKMMDDIKAEIEEFKDAIRKGIE